MSNEPDSPTTMLDYDFGSSTVTDFVMFYKSFRLFYTVCVLDKTKLVLLKTTPALKDGVLVVNNEKLGEINVGSEIVEVAGYTIDDK